MVEDSNCVMTYEATQHHIRSRCVAGASRSSALACEADLSRGKAWESSQRTFQAESIRSLFPSNSPLTIPQQCPVTTFQTPVMSVNSEKPHLAQGYSVSQLLHAAKWKLQGATFGGRFVCGPWVDRLTTVLKYEILQDCSKL